MPRPRTPSLLSRLPWWLVAMALLGLVTLWAIVSDEGYSAIFTTLSKGIVTTLWVSAVAFALALALGLGLALMRTSGSVWLRQIATFYVELIRGIPVLVALFYIAFVGAPGIIAGLNWLLTPLIENAGMTPLSVRDFDFTWRAILALTLCYAAFIGEILRAGIEAVPKGQLEAARSLGLTPAQTFRLVVAPQAFRTVLPPIANDFVSMIKDSALVSALGVQDITQLGKVYSSGTFKFFETYNVVAFLYLILTISLSLAIRLIERRLGGGRG